MNDSDLDPSDPPGHAPSASGSSEQPEAVSPARVTLGLLRATVAVAGVAVRARAGADPIALRPRVLGV